jgi:predicted Zn-dependent protease
MRLRNPPRTLVVPLAALALATLLASPACKSVPGTGRSQFNVIPEETENEMGAQAYAETTQQSKLVTSGKDYEMVQRVGTRIADAAKHMYPDPSKDFDWQIVLIDEPKTANAWCMPGGKMAVYTGLLPITQDEDSLAIVVGHEVGHAVARHGGERMSQDVVFQGIVQAAAMGTGKMDPGKRDQLMQALVGVGQYGVMLPFSRSHESEADELGLYLAADAGYDPRAALSLWDRMAAASQGQSPPEFLSTHPSEATRKEHLQELMPKALKIREKSSVAAKG